MAKTLKVWLYPPGWDSTIAYPDVQEIIQATEDKIVFKMRTETPTGVITQTKTSNLKYLIEEVVEHSGILSI
jgi:hypothetical protein